MTPARLPALVALLLLGGVLVAVVALTTPWNPLGDKASTRTPVDADRDFTVAERAREDAFHDAVRPPAYAGLVAGLVTAGVLGLTPLGARAARALPGPWAARAALAGVVLTLLPSLVALPFNARAEVVLRRYGLSTQGWPAWLLDQAKGWGLAAALGAVAATGLVLVGRLAPRWWWAWAGAAAALLVVVVSFLWPVVVEPMFNRFTPLEDGPLRTSLLQLARDDGVDVSDVLVADASRRTTALNAYVSGIGGTRRIVVYDTLLRGATEREVELVVAHELGHVKANDVLHGTLLGALGAATAVTLVYLLATSGLLRRAGADGLGDPAAVALLLFLFAALTQVVRPVEALVSRRVEARADVHSLDLSRDPETFVLSERRLAVTNLSDLDPHPLVYALFFSHPSGPERIATARDWARREGLPVPGDLAGMDAG